MIGRPLITADVPASISIGNRVSLISRSYATALGVSKPVILRTLTADATIQIGDDCGLSGTTICAAINVSIGNRVLVGADSTIVDTDFHPVDVVQRRYEPLPGTRLGDGIRIEDDVFIGANSIILRGVTVGHGSVVGAGSVVTRDVPPMTVVAGNPARAIRAVRAGEDSATAATRTA